ncbi:cyclic nucleotide-binding domain-containing protein [Actibacterium pelagium]|uniref:Cyclic nucleotide-binding domain-containing protein n=1 Tax=Actibacterium pelagium TaxID=2029103 RepID=A0A917EIJ3_9RHOB|nr:cyclic nucleotide-binding domain-containing protein [Actibacterium pelagium]GGE39084.1 hypothetical protein GCM10011517_03530 [Actibacterium pelagium]
MDWFTGLSVATLVYVAFALDLFGFLARDELRLRLLMLSASAMYLLYYFWVADEPLWDALLTNGALALVNLIMICVVVVERTTFSMARETAELYRLFPMLSPGQFRRLLRAGRAVEPRGEQALTQSGTTPDDLFFVIEGPVRIRKGEQETEIHGQLFIGEIAFLTGQPASASVSVGPGARYLKWNSATLKKLIDRSPKLHVALSAQFNKDLVNKVAQSHPL